MKTRGGDNAVACSSYTSAANEHGTCEEPQNTPRLTIGYSTQLGRVMALTVSRLFKQGLRQYCTFDLGLAREEYAVMMLGQCQLCQSRTG